MRYIALHKFPKLDAVIPSGGVLAPVGADELFVEVRERGEGCDILIFRRYKGMEFIR